MYGVDITPEDPKYVPLLHAALEGPTEAFLPGSFLVENIPILQYVPAWVPGAGFQKKFARWRLLAAELLNRPFADAKKAWVRPAASIHTLATRLAQCPDLPPLKQRGEGYHSAVHEMLEGISQANLSDAEAADEERVAKIGAANTYAAGADTVSFLLALCFQLPDAPARRSLLFCRSSWRWRCSPRFRRKLRQS